MAGKKRTNGEGTVFKRPDGRFQGQVYVLTSDGQKKRKSVYGKTAHEVVEKMNSAKLDSQKGIPIPIRSWRVSELLDYWLQREVAPHRRPLTYVEYEVVVRRYLKPVLGKKLLQELTVIKLQEYFNDAHVNGFKPYTLYRMRKVLRRALRYAMKLDLVQRNAASLIDVPTYVPEEAEHWTAEEAKSFLDAAKSERDYPVYLLCLLYGLRIGEVAGLRWSDIDFEQNILCVRQQVRVLKGQIHQGPLKTKSSKRDAPLLDVAAVALREYRVLQNKARAEWERAGRKWENLEGDEAVIFTTRTGRPISHSQHRRSFARICLQNGIRSIKFHGMRHTAATLLENSGSLPKDVSAILGHGDLRTTRIYEHADIENKRSALERLEGEFFQPMTAVPRGNGRQLLPSEPISQSLSTPFLSGVGVLQGPSEFTPRECIFSTVEQRLQSVIARIQVSRRSWLVGCVAVGVALNFGQPLNGETVGDVPSNNESLTSSEGALGGMCLNMDPTEDGGRTALDMQPL